MCASASSQIPASLCAITARPSYSSARLLGKDELRPGEEGWLQLELTEAVVAVRGDRYILRRPSPGETLGGGKVVDPHPKGRHRRFSQETLARLEALAQGTPTDILLQSLLAIGAGPLKEVIARSNLNKNQLETALDELRSTGALIILDGVSEGDAIQQESLVTSRVYWEQLAKRANQEIENYHQVNPLRRGMPREELKSRLKISPRLFTALIIRLVVGNQLQETGPLVSISGHQIRFDPEQEKAVQNLMTRFAASGFSPPSVKECQAEVGEGVYTALIDLGVLVQVSSEVVFSQELYDRMVTAILDLFKTHDTLSAAQVRDYFNTSRRYVLALLEHLDTIGLTFREGDVRRHRN